MEKVAFVDPKGLIIATNEIKSLELPEFKRNMDDDQVVGTEYTQPQARSIMPAELSLTFKDPQKNLPLLRYLENAFNSKQIVTLMFLSVEYISQTVARSDAEFYSGFPSRPGRAISPDKAADGKMTMSVTDSWRTENGVVVWRLPTGATDTIGIQAVYG